MLQNLWSHTKDPPLTPNNNPALEISPFVYTEGGWGEGRRGWGHVI